MDWKFEKRFRRLVNEDVPRTFLPSPESGSGHLTERDYGVPLREDREALPALEDGFIAKYCKG